MKPEDQHAILDWPTGEGIWMGWFQDCWFPFLAKPLKKYPPDQPHMPMPIVVQFPQSKTSWPYTFQACHPVKEWRLPDDDELAKAKHFYQI